jgi:glycosyltransferase involved in cell wall biosynthesis
MAEQVSLLVDALRTYLDAERTKADRIISHYWDGAKIGALYNDSLPNPIDHTWVPHSLGTVKKRNVAPERWEELRIDERISTEQELITAVDRIAATSSTIRQALKEDYGYQRTPVFLPPCVDPERYYPRKIDQLYPIWSLLSQHSGLSQEEIRTCRIVTEISRTDTTKRKDVLIKAFAKVHKYHPQTLLVVTIDKTKPLLAKNLRSLIDSLGITNHVAVLGSVWDDLPAIYAITDIYCTPSVMEGFGMSAQEAAATRAPVVASNLVPFATEYLLGNAVQTVHYQDEKPPLRVGEGAIVVPADAVDGFAYALEMLLSDDELRGKMAEKAYAITIPYFTWEQITRSFLEEAK